MFGEFVGKDVTIYMVNYANAMYNTYRVEGKMLESNDRITKIEVEEKKNRKFIQLINNGFVVYVEENIEPEKKEKKEKKEKNSKKNDKKESQPVNK